MGLGRLAAVSDPMGLVASLTGLKIPPYEVFVTSLEIIENFLVGHDETKSTRPWDLADMGLSQKGRPTRPIGVPGQVLVSAD